MAQPLLSSPRATAPWARPAVAVGDFIVLAGEMMLEFRDRSVAHAAGEMYVVPKGVEHRPEATSECSIMLLEPRGVVNTGDAGGAYTAPNDVWV